MTLRSRLSPTYQCELPRHFFIDVGNVCNLRCPFCPTGCRIPEAPRGFMSLEDFSIILSRISHAAGLICLYNWGEPFLNRDLLAMCRACADLGIPVHLDSNLSMRDFTPEEAEAVVSSGIHSIFASIDGATQQSYEKYRVGGRLDRVLGNLHRLQQAKARLGTSKPHLAWAYCVHRFNEHEIDDARQRAEQLGVPIFFRLLSTGDEAWFSSYHQTPDHPLFRLASWWFEAYPAPAAPVLDQIHLDSRLPEVCRQPFSTMVIDWNGEVTPCCAVFGSRYRLGNLLEQDLEAVWNGLPFRQCRQFLLNYGQGTRTGSVCETLACLVPKQPQG